MRPFPAVNIPIVKISAVLMMGAFLCLPVSLAWADGIASSLPESGQAASGSTTAQAAPEAGIDRESYLKGMQAALSLPAGSTAKTDAAPQEKKVNLGDANDPTSDRYKSDRLAERAVKDREKAAGLGQNYDIAEIPPPPEIDMLQMVNETLGGSNVKISEESVGQELSTDLRRDAQREAALSYGARGGLAKHNYEIMERMKDFDPVLDKVFNFRSLLINAPSGLMIEPPIIKQSDNALVITDGGDEAAVAKQVYDINKRAKIVSAPRDWRQYLVQTWSDVPPPPRILWPKNAEEQTRWNGWVAQGWRAGVEQAEQIFESNTNRLVADYNGMVRYKMLLAQNMISQPYAMHEDRGVTGDKNQMRVGDRALRITGPSQFLTGADLWKPADR